MRVRELLIFLRRLPPSMEVVTSGPEAGKGYSPLIDTSWNDSEGNSVALIGPNPEDIVLDLFDETDEGYWTRENELPENFVATNHDFDQEAKDAGVKKEGEI